jgi:hypothetical protein
MTRALAFTVRRCLLITLAVLLVLAVLPVPQLLAVAKADPEPCVAEKAAADADKQAILEHNSRKSPVPVPPSVGIPYNEEAAALRAKGAADRAKLRSCVVARLTSDGPAPPALSDARRDALDQARRNTPPGWRAPASLPTHSWNRNVVVPKDSPAKPVYDAVRRMTPQSPYPDVPLQGQPRPKIGDPNPARPGQIIGKNDRGGPAVSPDHIVPIAEIVQMPGFMALNPDNMWLVINAPLNLQWLPVAINRSKGSRSAIDVLEVDSAWQTVQTQLQETKRQELITIIAQLADSQTD